MGEPLDYGILILFWLSICRRGTTAKTNWPKKQIYNGHS